MQQNYYIAGTSLPWQSASEGVVPTSSQKMENRFYSHHYIVCVTVQSCILSAPGARIVGKSLCEDLCVSGQSSTAVYGPVMNPHDKERSAGGSSGGSAVLVSGLGWRWSGLRFCVVGSLMVVYMQQN